jgi:hypothetical protein
VAEEFVGHGVVRASGQLVQMKTITIVLEMQQYNGKLYYISTSFPTP